MIQILGGNGEELTFGHFWLNTAVHVLAWLDFVIIEDRDICGATAS